MNTINLIYKNKIFYSFHKHAINYHYPPKKHDKIYNNYIFMDKIRNTFEELYNKIYYDYYWNNNYNIILSEKEYNQITILLCFQ